MSSTARTKFIFPVLAICLSVLGIELVLRLFVKPPAVPGQSYGRFLGFDLPPVRLIPQPSPPDQKIAEQIPDANDPQNRPLFVDGKAITYGDMHGSFQFDKELGSLHPPNWKSANGWLQTNALGATARTETSRQVPAQTSRVLLFGDSVTDAYGVPIEQSWAHQLGAKNKKLEVVNFGVAGFSMGQSLLRFRQIRKEVQYNTVIFTMQPRGNLWREVNTLRYLAQGWKSYSILPRFVVQGSKLEAVPPLYSKADEVYKNYDHPTPELKEHLHKYDDFYVKIYHDPVPVLEHFMIYKLAAMFIWKLRLRELRKPILIYQADGRLMQMMRTILLQAQGEVQADHARFYLGILPNIEDYSELKSNPKLRRAWAAMVASFQGAGIATLDFWPIMEKALQNKQFDTSYEGTHLGPRVGGIIADGWTDYLKAAR